MAPGLAACEGGIGPGEDEPLASGLRISSQESVLVTASGPTASGTLRVAAGAESPVLEVTFLDPGGQPLTPGPGLSLQAHAHLSSLATLQVVSPSAFTVQLSGAAQGTTTARFTLLRNGRAEYISPPVEVAVGPPES